MSPMIAWQCAFNDSLLAGSSSAVLGRRRTCSLLEQRRSASAAHCSTSGASPFWSRKSCQAPKRRGGGGGQCRFASEGSSLGQVSVVEKDGFMEIVEWRSRNNTDIQQEPVEAPGRDSEGDVETETYSSDRAEVKVESAGDEKLLESDRAGNSNVGQEGLEGEEREAPKEAGQQGWRRLASSQELDTQLAKSKPTLVQRPWRKSNSRRQRYRSADNLARQENPKVSIIKQDRNLEALFNSLSSPRKTDRNSAVERFSGNVFDEQSVANGSSNVTDDVTSFPSGISEGGTDGSLRSSQGTNTASPRKEGRLRINLDLYLFRAKCLRDKGLLDEAEAILKECIRDWPDDGRAYLALGLLALPLNSEQVKVVDKDMVGEVKKKNLPGVGKVRLFPGDFLTYEDSQGASSGKETVPRSPAVSEGGVRLKINLDLQLYHAKCLKQKGRSDVAETVLRKCIRDWPDDGRPYVALGKMLLQQNRIQEVRAVYESGCQACRGENPYIWQAWAVLEQKCGDCSKARKLFDAATVADKKHAPAWHGWAILEVRSGNVRRARSLLNKGLKFCGSNEYIYQTLGLLEYKDGKLEEARALFSKATRYNSKSAASWLAWALMEAENNFIDVARRLFQKGVEASPKNRYVWLAWARFEAKQGKEKRARELFQRGRELNPKDVVLLQAFALFEYSCGQPGIARDLFRRALQLDSSHQPVWIAWGWMEWKEGNLSVARDFYQGAVQVDPRAADAARAFQAWGVLEDRAGDTALARELFKCALKIDSQNVPTWMSWAAMEDREGRSVRADEIRNQFLRERTEVVEGPWDVDFSDFLAPAIDRIKGFFKRDPRKPIVRLGAISSEETDLPKETSDEVLENVDRNRGGPSLDLSDDTEFDVDTFLKKKFPWKYGFLEPRKSRSSSKRTNKF